MDMNDCPVCLNNLIEDIVTLKCNHSICFKCFLNVLKYKNEKVEYTLSIECPLCRSVCNGYNVRWSINFENSYNKNDIFSKKLKEYISNEKIIYLEFLVNLYKSFYIDYLGISIDECLEILKIVYDGNKIIKPSFSIKNYTKEYNIENSYSMFTSIIINMTMCPWLCYQEIGTLDVNHKVYLSDAVCYFGNNGDVPNIFDFIKLRKKNYERLIK